MKKIIKKNGDVFKIDLRPIFPLHAYAQYIDLTKYIDKAYYPDIMIIYDYFDSIPDEQMLVALKDRDWLINPVYISGGYSIAKMFNYVGNILPHINDTNIPPIRKSIPDDAEENGSEIIAWDVIMPDNIKINPRPMHYSEVIHLDPLSAIINVKYLSFRISLALCKLRSLSLPPNLHLDWYHKIIIRATSDIPLWKDIPESKRSKL